MKLFVVPILASFIATIASAAEPTGYYGRTIFTDDFSGDKFGPRWGHYKSGSIVKDGLLIGITPEGSDHSAVDSVKFAPERDLEVSVKFRFASPRAKSFNVWFDDKDYRGSHAGHICSISVSPTAVTIADAKTGRFRNDIYEKGKAPGGLNAADKAFLQTKTKSQPGKLALLAWHTLGIRTRGDGIEVFVDGKVAATFKSEGIAHDHKTLVSLTTNPVDVHYDDFCIKAAGPTASNP